MTLLEIFRNPEGLAKIALSAKITGALQITVIGMALTFVALVLVWLAVRLLARFAAKSPARQLPPIPIRRPATTDDDGEQVAAIAAVVPLIDDGSPNRIRVKKIVRGPTGVSRWAARGR